MRVRSLSASINKLSCIVINVFVALPGKHYHPLEVDFMCNRTPSSWQEVLSLITKDDIAEQALQDMAKEKQVEVMVKREKQEDASTAQHSQRSQRSERSIQVKRITPSTFPLYNTKYNREDVLKMFKGPDRAKPVPADVPATVPDGVPAHMREDSEPLRGPGKRKLGTVHGHGGGDNSWHAKRQSRERMEEDAEEVVLDADEEEEVLEDEEEETDEPDDPRMGKEQEGNSDEDVSGVSHEFQEREAPTRRQPTRRAAAQTTSPSPAKGKRPPPQHASPSPAKGKRQHAQQPASPKAKKVTHKGTPISAKTSPGKKAKMYERRALLAVLASPPDKKKL